MNTGIWIVDVRGESTEDKALCANPKSVAEVLFRRVLRNKKFDFPSDAERSINMAILDTYNILNARVSPKFGDTVNGGVFNVKWTCMFLPLLDFSDDILTNYDLHKIQGEV